MINPLEGKEFITFGRGLSRLHGDLEPGIRPMPGDFGVGERPLPGDYRMAGTLIKGLAQYDPAIFAKLFA